MLADLSDALARLAFSRLAPDRAHPAADLDRLPPLLAHALRQRLHREVSARLNAAAPWVSAVPDLWREDAAVEARYPSSAWAPAVREASEWILAALVHPADALSEAAPESGTRGMQDVLDRMSDLGAYPYLGEIVERYAQKKELEGYDRATLHGLIDRVDRRIASELGAEGWQALLGPLYDVVGALPDFPEGVPGRVLAEVFAARGRPGLGAAVVSRETVSREALAEVIAEGLAPEPEEPEPDADAPEVIALESHSSAPSVAEESVTDAVEVDSTPAAESAEAEPVKPTEDEASVEAKGFPGEPIGSEPADEPPVMGLESSGLDPLPPFPDASAHDEEPDAPPPATTPTLPASGRDLEEKPDDEPLWARLARERSGAPDSPEAHAEAGEPEPLWRRFTPESGAPEGTSIAPESVPERQNAPPPSLASAEAAAHLESRVLGESADQHSTYVEHLFRGDEADYHRVIGLLADARSWSEATDIIGREVFRRYQTPIYSEPAVSFTDAVERRFSRG